MWPKANSWTAFVLLRRWTHFNVYAMWRHHFLERSQASDAELEEFEEALKLCRDDFLRHAFPEAWMADHESVPHLREKLHELGSYSQLESMTDHEVVQAVIDELTRDQFLLCPDRDSVPKYVERARVKRAERYRELSSSREYPTLGNVDPFTYKPYATSGNLTELAARGVTEAHEADCYAQYERDIDECRAYRSALGGTRFMDACAQRAFLNYQQCRGY